MANPTPSDHQDEQLVRPGIGDDTSGTAVQQAREAWALRGNSFGAIVMLLVQYGLGMWVNLYGQLPASDHGASLVTGFTRAVSRGPVGLSIHAILGVLLLASAAAALVRAIRIRRSNLIGPAIVGLVAIAVAGLSGARFVGSMTNSASITMALAAAVAIGAYAVILLIPPQQPVTAASSPARGDQTTSQ